MYYVSVYIISETNYN